VEAAGGPDAAYDASIRRTTFVERLRRGDTYGILLILIIGGLVLMGAFENTRWSRVVTCVLFGMILLLALHTSRAPRWLSGSAVGVIVVCLVLTLTEAISRSDRGIELAAYIVLALTAMAPVVILVRIARHPTVNLETILGALSAYLLIGLVFSGVYRAVQAITDDAFFTQSNRPDPLDFLYFSFTTLTTTGFGDLTPATDAGKVLVNLEQLTGQIFLVTIVAGLVSSFGRSRRLPAD
jgi:voltage-gated potassium channel